MPNPALGDNHIADVQPQVAHRVAKLSDGQLDCLRLVDQHLEPLNVERGQTVVGRHSFRPAAEAVALAEAAELLRLEEDAVRGLAEGGGLPGRKVGEEWRFSREAVLAWLAEG